MSMKPGCVVYNPAMGSWCVMVETVRDAHYNVYKDADNVKISMFEYDYISDDQEIIGRLILDGIEYLREVEFND